MHVDQCRNMKIQAQICEKLLHMLKLVHCYIKNVAGMSMY
jgi:hypothetical protein